MYRGTVRQCLGVFIKLHHDNINISYTRCTTHLPIRIQPVHMSQLWLYGGRGVEGRPFDSTPGNQFFFRSLMLAGMKESELLFVFVVLVIVMLG